MMKLNTIVKVNSEYIDNDESRELSGLVVEHEYNEDYLCIDNIVLFTDGTKLPFQDHELTIVK